MLEVFSRFHAKWVAALAVLGLFAVGVIAQIEGNSDRGVPPVDSITNFEVTGISIDVAGKSADAVRKRGWREAQRKGWQMLWKKMHGSNGPNLSDGQLDGMVNGIIVEEELISENRYIAKLGIAFDRARASEILGMGGRSRKSAPLLLIPIVWEGGVPQSFETRTEWQKAWAGFRTDESPMDYVRPVGNGADPILLNAAQTTRPGRKWWREMLDQYGAVDVLIAEVQLKHSYPGGPITGYFVARYGPDNKRLGSFTLSTAPDKIQQMMLQGVKQMDGIYSAALASGILKPDTSLILEQIITEEEVDIPTTQAVVVKKDDKPKENTGDKPKEADKPKEKEEPKEVEPATQMKTITVYVDTPDPGSVMEAEAAVRGVAGVKSSSTISTAVGGLSVIRVSYEGDGDMLKVALAARGYRVSGGGAAIRIAN